MNRCILRRFSIKILQAITLSTAVLVLSYVVAVIVDWLDGWWYIVKDACAVFCLLVVLPIAVIAMLVGMYKEARKECSKQE